MTPQARVAAAIDVLEHILHGQPAEKTLTTWARKNRYAGSKDRAAVRDLVFDALRQKRSFAHMGHAETGRGIMIGQTRLSGNDPSDIFTGEGYGPPALTAEEEVKPPPLAQAEDGVRLDCPDWLLPMMCASLGEAAEATLLELRKRAPVFVRANTAKCSCDEAISALGRDDIDGRAHPLSPTAIEITKNPRKLRQSNAFLDGLVELQDAASQAVVDMLVKAVPKGRVLDYCAGGGGKSLAMAAAGLDVSAHDADVDRMRDLPDRARRAGAVINTISKPSATYDAVLCDVPCSGSGAWRRQPEAKWRLTAEVLAKLNETQDAILDSAVELVQEAGILAYATCSLLKEENDARIGSFLQRHPMWTLRSRQQFTPLDGADGFFIALLEKT
ncbi:MAG: RsmB/NOP family class I SAM-dependent RNA methyltransferase [Silicimonas sp.]|nr:RsmB/NOP family class I SAM-dependent RNA methyltransferase [Silicimonas sp.]